MAFCIHCGTDLLVDEARFCPMCGRPQPPLPAQAAEEAGETDQVAAGRATTQAAPPESGQAEKRDVSEQSRRKAPAIETPADDAVGAAGEAPARVSRAAAAAAAAGSDRVQAGGGGVAVAEAAPPRPQRAAGGEARLWRLGWGDWYAALGSLLLLVFLFLPWFSGRVEQEVGTGTGLPGNFGGLLPAALTTDAMGAGLWHWLIFLLAVGVVVYIAARTLPGEGLRIPLPHWQILTTAAVVNLGLVAMAAALPPSVGSWTIQYGAIASVLAALLAVFGAVHRRLEPEVITSPDMRVATPRMAAQPRRTRSRADVRREARRWRRERVVTILGSSKPETTVIKPGVGEPAPMVAGETPSDITIMRRVPVEDRTQRAELDEDAKGARRPGKAARGEGPATGMADASTSRPAAGPEAGAAAGAGSAQPSDAPDATGVVRRAEREPVAALAPSDELLCAICATPNPPTARVCRTCGVMLGPRTGRR